VRCAIYTRKSHEEGLEQEFNSLDQQREAAEAYVESQKREGWVALPERYDDPAFSAATLERPALRRLLSDIEAGRVDVVLVYKIDRLSRSLRDFVQLIDLFEKHGVSFVSVTQRFDTSSSMGKLTLNVLMSFAEFEREVIGERIRDKIAAAKRRGKHTGGMPVLGYDTIEKRLVVNPEEAKLVRRVFKRFCALRSAMKVAEELNREGRVTKSWKTAKGEHEAIVERALWDEAHRVLEENHRDRANRTRAQTPALLKGLVRCGHCQCAMGPSFTRKDGRTYRYYLCVQASKKGYATCPVKTVSAGAIEGAVVDQLRAVFRSPELVARTFREARARESEEVERLRGEKRELEERLAALRERAARLLNAKGDGAKGIAEDLRATGDEVDEAKRRLERVEDDLRALETQTVSEEEVVDALGRLDPIFDELFPAEKNRIVGLLVERVEVRPDGLEVRLRGDGLRSLVAELAPAEDAEMEARAG
jgi:site-specific DNA recombinase